MEILGGEGRVNEKFVHMSRKLEITVRWEPSYSQMSSWDGFESDDKTRLSELGILRVGLDPKTRPRGIIWY